MISAHCFGEFENPPAGTAGKTVEGLGDQVLHAGSKHVGVEEFGGFRCGKFREGREVDDEILRAVENGLAGWQHWRDFMYDLKIC